MKVFVRTEASVRIGTGHVMRCLALADRLRAGGAEVVFVCREAEGSYLPYIRNRGYEVKQLAGARLAVAALSEQPMNLYRHGLFGVSWDADAEQTIALLSAETAAPDWLIVDHYGLDGRYEAAVQPHVRQLMVIDDLADRPHRCELLLDQNVHAAGSSRYRGLVPPDCKLLLGARYALLRPEFAEERPRVRRDGRVRHVLLTFGGTDPTGETAKTLLALRPLIEEGLTVTVLTGSMNPEASKIAELCEVWPGVRCMTHSDHMAQLMREADLAIGSGGTTTWERCCMGLPSLVVTTAGNQEELTKEIAEAGAVRWLGKAGRVETESVERAVRDLMNKPLALLNMSACGMELVDGLGTERTAEELLSR